MWFFVTIFVVPILFEIQSKVTQLRNSPAPHQTKFTPQETAALLELRSYKFKLTRSLEALGVDPETRNWILVTESDPYFNNDHVLIRFLRAQNLNVASAAQMIVCAVKWRRENKIDSILNETFPDLPSDHHIFEGYDNEGRPVVYFTPNAVNLRKLLLAGKRDRLLRRLDKVLEEGLHVIRNLTLGGHRSLSGNEITQFVLVYDGAGFNMANHMCFQCSTLLMDWMFHYENYYPDAFKYMVSINSPRNAVPLMNMFSHVASRASQRAIKIFGPDKLKWSTFLRSIIPPDQIPVRYGGNMPSKLH